MMMKSVIWWRKPEYPEETTDLRQVTDETFHTYGLCPVRGLNLGRSGVSRGHWEQGALGAGGIGSRRHWEEALGAGIGRRHWKQEALGAGGTGSRHWEEALEAGGIGIMQW